MVPRDKFHHPLGYPMGSPPQFFPPGSCSVTTCGNAIRSNATRSNATCGNAACDIATCGNASCGIALQRKMRGVVRKSPHDDAPWWQRKV